MLERMVFPIQYEITHAQAEALQQTFGPYGELQHVKVVKDKGGEHALGAISRQLRAALGSNKRMPTPCT